MLDDLAFSVFTFWRFLCAAFFVFSFRLRISHYLVERGQSEYKMTYQRLVTLVFCGIRWFALSYLLTALSCGFVHCRLGLLPSKWKRSYKSYPAFSATGGARGENPVGFILLSQLGWVCWAEVVGNTFNLKPNHRQLLPSSLELLFFQPEKRGEVGGMLGGLVWSDASLDDLFRKREGSARRFEESGSRRRK